jgi:hypothetical protein
VREKEKNMLRAKALEGCNAKELAEKLEEFFKTLQPDKLHSIHTSNYLGSCIVIYDDKGSLA